MLRSYLKLLSPALTDFIRNNCHYMAAGVAYWTLFSLFPLALAGIAVLGYVYTTPQDHDRIVEGVVELVPVSEDYLTDLVQDVTQSRGALGLLAILGLTWTGTSVFSAVRKGINHAWHVNKPPYFLLERAIDLLMLLGVAVLAIAHLVFSGHLFGDTTLLNSISHSGVRVVATVALEFIVLAVTIGAFALLYRFVPHTEVEWRDVWLGAVVGAVMFDIVRLGLEALLSGVGNLNLVYGSLSAIMAVLIWAYLASIAIIWGAQLTYTYSGVFGSRAGTIVLPGPKTASGASAPAHHGIRGVISILGGWLVPPKKERP